MQPLCKQTMYLCAASESSLCTCTARGSSSSREVHNKLTLLHMSLYCFLGTMLSLQVRSFQPLEAFLYSGWYGRMANLTYQAPSGTETVYERHFSVTCYDEDERSRAQQVDAPCMSPRAAVNNVYCIQALLRRQYSGLPLRYSRQTQVLTPSLPSLQLMVSNADMKAEFEKQGINIPDFEEQLRRTVRQLLEAAAPQASQLATGNSSPMAYNLLDGLKLLQ